MVGSVVFKDENELRLPIHLTAISAVRPQQAQTVSFVAALPHPHARVMSEAVKESERTFH